MFKLDLEKAEESEVKLQHLLGHRKSKRVPEKYLKESESEVAQSCQTLCDPMDCSLPGSSVHGIFQATILEWAAISFSRGSSQPRDQTEVSRIVGRCFYHLSHQGRKISTSALILHQSLSLCGSQQTVGNSSRDGSIRPPYLPPEKSV